MQIVNRDRLVDSQYYEFSEVDLLNKNVIHRTAGRTAFLQMRTCLCRLEYTFLFSKSENTSDKL